MLIHNIRHIGLVVSDIDKSLEFYHNILGLKIQGKTDENDEFIKKLLKNENSHLKTIKLSTSNNATRIELISIKNKLIHSARKQLNETGLTHISLTVNNLDKIYEVLKQKNVEFNCPPTLSPDKTLKVTFCKDFEGNFLELTEEM